METTKNLPRPDFFVSAIGEMFRGEELLDCSYLTLPDVGKKAGLEWTGNIDSEEWKAAIKSAEDEKMAAELIPTEIAFVRLRDSFDDVSSSRWRVYGGIYAGTPQLFLVTEFCELIEDKEFWIELYKTVEALKATVWVMREDEHLDHSWKTDAGNTYEVFGPNHDKLERQVELSWRIEDKTPEEVRVLVTALAEGTQKYWERAGVSVL